METWLWHLVLAIQLWQLSSDNPALATWLFQSDFGNLALTTPFGQLGPGNSTKLWQFCYGNPALATWLSEEVHITCSTILMALYI